jgi:hypothetical protein
MFKSILAVAALSVIAVSAQASVTAGLANQNPTSFIVLSAADDTGGALYSGGSIPGVAAVPFNLTPSKITVGDWLAAGPGNTNNGGGNAVVDFGVGGTNFVSFLWGSPDTYNTLVVTEVGGATTAFTSLNLPLFIYNGNQNFASYVGFSGNSGSMIQSLTFESPRINAFEASNFSVTTPIPEPETYALMLAGLGAIGFVARRRKSV